MMDSHPNFSRWLLYTTYGLYAGFALGGVRGLLTFRKLKKTVGPVKQDDLIKGKHVATALFFQQGVRYAINSSLFIGTFTAVDSFCHKKKVLQVSQLDKINYALNAGNDGRKADQLFRLEHKMIAGLATGMTFGSLATVRSGSIAHNLVAILGYSTLLGLFLGLAGGVAFIPIESMKWREEEKQEKNIHQPSDEQFNSQIVEETNKIRNTIEDESYLLETIKKEMLEPVSVGNKKKI